MTVERSAVNCFMVDCRARRAVRFSRHNRMAVWWRELSARPLGRLQPYVNLSKISCESFNMWKYFESLFSGKGGFAWDFCYLCNLQFGVVPSSESVAGPQRRVDVHRFFDCVLAYLWSELFAGTWWINWNVYLWYRILEVQCMYKSSSFGKYCIC